MTRAINIYKSDKDFRKTALLCIFLGLFGAHRFYVGKTSTAIIQFALLGGFGIWTLMDLVKIISSNFEDEYGLPIQQIQNL